MKSPGTGDNVMQLAGFYSCWVMLAEVTDQQLATATVVKNRIRHVDCFLHGMLLAEGFGTA